MKNKSATKNIELVNSESPHPCHSKQRIRLNRIRGQVDAIDRMIEERRYCPEIIQQVKAAASALKALEREVLRTHLKHCVKQAMTSSDPFEVDSKIEEITKMLS
jgi:DNA-binding FrmR family transcriptional regulator